jgi:hypothetical protein
MCTVPAGELSGFEVSVTTGRVATDADIFFCVQRRSDANRDCALMGEEFVDDWDVGSIGTYRITTTVAAGDLAGVTIENRGDAPDLSFDGNSWELDGVRVVAQTSTGGVLVLEEEDLGFAMDAGDRWEPTSCFF